LTEQSSSSNSIS